MLSFESSSSFFLLTILLLHHAGAGEAQPHGSPPDPYGQSFNPSMGVVIIVLIAALFFMGFFSIYIRHCSRDESSISNGPTRRAYVGSVARSRRAQRGLDRAVIESFPTFDYAAVKELKIGKDALECAVCLTEFEDDDTLRLIPKCDHVFHPDCIDAWLVAHTTCPVCRSNLIPDLELATCPHEPPQNEVLVNVNEDETTSSVVVEEEARDEHENQERESMEQPLQGRTMSRSRTMRRNISIGRPRSWLGRMRYVRSFSTGHVAVKQWENMERFTLRLPDEVRKQLVNGKLERSTSLVVLPRETSSRRRYRTGTGFGEGSSRGGWFGLNRSDRSGRSDRWIFSLAPPFFSRAPSVKSPKVVAAESRQGSLHGSVRSESNRLPV